jgi:hypothetical protein
VVGFNPLQVKALAGQAKHYPLTNLYPVEQVIAYPVVAEH